MGVTTADCHLPDSHTHVTQHWLVEKPSARGRRGMVVAQVRTAAEAGIDILDAGGTAVDAAIAATLALAVVEPWNAGLGAVGYAVVDGSDGEPPTVVDFGPVTPRGLSGAWFKLTGRPTTPRSPWPEVEQERNTLGPLSITIPSALAGLEAMHRSWGRLPFDVLLEPAIVLARRGLPIDWFSVVRITNAARTLRTDRDSAGIFLPDGLPSGINLRGDLEHLRNDRLLDTLQRLRQAGVRDFYRGDLAGSIVADLNAKGGVLVSEDLSSYAVRASPGLAIGYRDYHCHAPRDRTAGPALAAALSHLQEHLPAEASEVTWRQAVAAALWHAQGPETRPADARATADSCTSHLSVWDEAGMVVSLTTTLLSAFGSQVMLPETGILLNNGVMWFDPRPSARCPIGPSRRPETNMCPLIVRQGGRSILAAGASGGRRIVGSLLQVVSGILDRGLSAEAAAHAPRIDLLGPGALIADERISAPVRTALEATWSIAVAQHRAVPPLFGCPSLIMQERDGTRVGLSDVMSPWSAGVAQ